ncbi:MAG TPA: tetratricopeptide repeat protein [Candidatus Polarisedimenticolia bacterium]|nr:tetratricopeptide repeat protein [Candidatus Polarisedimenticolia bacterium]
MTRRMVTMALVLGVLVTGTGCQGTIARLKANYATKQGNEAYKAQDFLKAIEWYRYATYLNADLDLAYYNSALSYLALYRPGSKHPKDIRYSEQAIANLKRYLAVHPDSEDAKNYLLTVYLGAERFDEAGEFFQTELKAHGDDPQRASQLMQIIGVIYTKKGDFDTALEWYKKRADLEKENPEVLYTIGVLCWDKVYKGGLQLELARRNELIDMGLDYLNRASALRTDYMEAVSYINLMYREKAKSAAMVGDNDGAAKWNAEADKYMHQALDLRKKAMAAAQK